MLGLLQERQTKEEVKVPPRKSLTSWGADNKGAPENDTIPVEENNKRRDNHSVSGRSSDDLSYLQTGTYDKEVPASSAIVVRDG